MNSSKKTHGSQGVKEINEVHKVCEAHDETVGLVPQHILLPDELQIIFNYNSLNLSRLWWEVNIFLLHHHTFRITVKPWASRIYAVETLSCMFLMILPSWSQKTCILRPHSTANLHDCARVHWIIYLKSGPNFTSCQLRIC